MFTTFRNGTLISFSLLTRKHLIYKGGKYDLQNVHRIAIDYNNQLVYAIASLTAVDTPCLVRLDYAGTALIILFRGPEINASYGLDIFKNFVVWENEGNGKVTIYLCELSPICKQENIKQLYSSNSEVSTLNSFNSSNNT